MSQPSSSAAVPASSTSAGGGPVVDIHDVYHNSSRHHGQLRITHQGVGWKSSTSDTANGSAGGPRVVTFNGNDIKQAVWNRVARGYRLRLTVGKAGERHYFEGLQREDLDRIQKALKNFSVDVEVREISVRGWNWGKADVQAQDLVFAVGPRSNTLFEIPLDSVSNSNMAGRNEVALEFGQSQQAQQGAKVDELVEMRFYIPNVRPGDDDDDDAFEVEVDEDGNEITAAEGFHRAITERADIGEAAGDAIVTFGEVLVVTPRGRFDIEMHADHLRLHGKTYDYRVLYKSVHRQFLLPKLDGVHRQLIVGLDPPLRQGQTKYPWLVMQWDESEEVDVTLNIEDDVLQDKYKGLIQKEYSEPTYLVVSKLFRHLIGKEMTPPSSTYRSVTGDVGFKCNVKAVQGELYFLEHGMIFVAKQPIHIDFARIKKAILTRLAGAMRTCDLVVNLDSGTEHTFTSINKDELNGIKGYLKRNNVRIKEHADDTAMRDIDQMDLGEDEDAYEDDENENGRSKPKKVSKQNGMDEDDDEEEDGDFAADSDDDGGSASSSDSDASGAGSDDGVVSDDMMDDLGKKAKAKAPKYKGEKIIGGDNDKPKKKKQRRE